tara:strand:+ start:1424 stop:1837 length:414 start_codon:yes stop_codon:yes gene_type:complete
LNQYKYQDLFVGQTASFEVNISKNMVEKFRIISGDENSLHVDRAFAKKNGFKDRVCYGMLTASFFSKLVGVYLPGKYALLNNINLLFIEPVYIGDVLIISGEIVYKNDAFQQIEIKANIKRSDKVVVKTKIQVGVTQ